MLVSHEMGIIIPVITLKVKYVMDFPAVPEC